MSIKTLVFFNNFIYNVIDSIWGSGKMKQRIKHILWFTAFLLSASILIFSPFAAGAINRAATNCPKVVNGPQILPKQKSIRSTNTSFPENGNTFRTPI